MDPEALFIFLEQQQLIPEGTSQEFLAKYESGEGDLFEFIEASGLGSKSEILDLLADHFETSVIDLHSTTIKPALITALGPDIAKIYRCIPTQISEEEIKLCIVDPLDELALAELSRLLGKKVKLVIADPSQIEEKLTELLRPLPDVAPETASVPSSASHAHRGAALGKLDMFWACAIAAVALASSVMVVAHTRQSRILDNSRDYYEKADASAKRAEALQACNAAFLRDIKMGMSALEIDLSELEAKAQSVKGFEVQVAGTLGKVQAVMEQISAQLSESRDLPVQNSLGNEGQRP